MRRSINHSLFLRCILSCIFISFLSDLCGQSNYVRTYVPKEPVSPGISLNESNALVSTAYYDSGGRLVQTVHHGITPSGKDMADLIVYDHVGRCQREWQLLPFDSSDGSYKQASAFDSSPYKDHYHVDYEYEPSVWNRVTAEIGRNTPGRSVTTEYLLNAGSTGFLCVTHYTLSGFMVTRNGNYPDGSLTCVKRTNEDGESDYVFTNAHEKVVLERHVGLDYTYDTYFLYDRFDQLVCVLPPAVSENWESSAGSYVLASGNLLDHYAYFYEYDYFNNCISSKLPGAGWYYKVYDGDHRMILSQSPNQRFRSEWSFCKYDLLDRIILEGTVRNSNSHHELVRSYMDTLVCESYDGTGTFGYTNRFPLGESPRITKVSYYDTESFLSLPLFHSLNVVRPQGAYSSCQSLLTGCYLSLNDGEGTGELQSFSYDKRKRLIGSSIYNAVSRATTYTFTEYNELNAPVLINRRFVSPDGTCLSDMSYHYDNGGRETASALTVSLSDGRTNQSRTFPSRELTYDEFCRPVFEQITSGERISTVYRTDGKLGGLESARFSQTLHYSDVPSCFWNEYFNGRISAVSIRQLDNSYRMFLSYGDRQSLCDMAMYTYDGTGYLRFKESMGYDIMGNIRTLTRQTPLGDVNVLSFEYTGNHFKSSYDHSSSRWPDAYSFLYHSWEPEGAFGYDDNGNETRNLAQNVEYAHYNNHNLPDSVCFPGGNTLLLDYLSDGRRVRTNTKTYRTALIVPLDDLQLLSDPSSETEEVRDGDFLFRDGRLSRLETPGGYVSLRNDTTGEKRIRGYYYIKDYLGSVRLTCDYETGEVLQSMEYLPSGAIFRRTGYDIQNRRFCGKEELSMHGFNMYDSGARLQYTLVPRFSTMDPLLEKYYDISPYVYCANNPVRFIDPTGMIWEDPQEAERLKKNIDNRITSLNKDIVRNQDKLDKGGLSEKQIGKLESRISEANNRISNLNTSKADIDLLGADQSNVYALSSISGGKHKVRQGSDGKVYIETSSDALSIHEVTHVRQSLDAGGLRFSTNGELLNAGVGIRSVSNMEIEAYKMQYSYDRSFPGSLRGRGLQGIDVHSVGGITNDGKHVYPVIYQYSIDLNKFFKQQKKLIGGGK